MIVYLDIIWLLNLLVDSLLLWTTAIFLKRTIHPFRIVAGGLLGSLLILLAITPLSGFTAHPFVKIIFSIGMVLISFGFKKASTFFTSLFTFYFATFLMGGILMGTHYLLSYQFDLSSAVALESIKGYGDPVSWLFLFGAFPIAWQFSKRRIDGITISHIQYDVLTNVSIKINNIELELKGLIDSGNQLYDPITKTPVMIVSIQSIKEKLPAEILSIAKEKGDIYEATSDIPPEWSCLMRLIPAKTLGNSNQLLCAFKPDYVALHENGMKVEKKAFIVFTTQNLSSDGRFQCIIHPHMASVSIRQTAS